MLRSVGSNNMSPLEPCFRKEWHVVCQRVREVFLFQLRGTLVLGLAFFFFFLFFLLLLGVLYMETASFAGPLLSTKLGLFWCASNWARPLGVVWSEALPF